MDKTCQNCAWFRRCDGCGKECKAGWCELARSDNNQRLYPDAPMCAQGDVQTTLDIECETEEAGAAFHEAVEAASTVQVQGWLWVSEQFGCLAHEGRVDAELGSTGL